MFKTIDQVCVVATLVLIAVITYLVFSVIHMSEFERFTCALGANDSATCMTAQYLHDMSK